MRFSLLIYYAVYRDAEQSGASIHQRHCLNVGTVHQNGFNRTNNLWKVKYFFKPFQAENYSV